MRLFASLSLPRPRFDPRQNCLIFFFVNKLTLGQVLTEYVGFPLSVIFHQCYIFLLIYLFTQSFLDLAVTLNNLSD